MSETDPPPKKKEEEKEYASKISQFNQKSLHAADPADPRFSLWARVVSEN